MWNFSVEELLDEEEQCSFDNETPSAFADQEA